MRLAGHGLVAASFCFALLWASSAASATWDCYYAWADKAAWDAYQEVKGKTPCCAREPRIFADSLSSIGVDHDAAVVNFWLLLFHLAAHDPSYRGRHVVTGPKCVVKVAP